MTQYPTCPECSHKWSQGLWYTPFNNTTAKSKVCDIIPLSQRQVEIAAINSTKSTCRDEVQILDVEQRFCLKCESLNSQQMHDEGERYESTWYRCRDCGYNHSSVVNRLDDDGDEEGWTLSL